MNNRHILKTVIFTSILWGILAFSKTGFSHSIVVDFETNPTIINAPTTPGMAGPAQTIEVDNLITFKGGVVLAIPDIQPSIPFLTTPNFYGTIYHPTGGLVGHSTLSPTLSIDIVSSFNAFSVEGVLLNGLTRPGSYLIEAFSHGSLVDSVSLSLAAFSKDAPPDFEIFRLSSVGQEITSVIFSPGMLDGEWNYFIDAISINIPIEGVIHGPAAVPVPAGFWLFATGVVGLFGMGKTRNHPLAFLRI